LAVLSKLSAVLSKQASLPIPVQDILIGQAKFVDNHTIKYGLPGRVDVGGQVTAKDVIIATGSVPFVPPGTRT
jgi:pyruvate/2-oxoglutarate dehydrogenase complex dihydrolipoamide dehydrogenase (E3) component